jgi:O-antigen/teichoic acid export membrane protein
MYLGIVLHAMATDYLPRLSAVADDQVKLGRLVNEQAEILVLVGGPIIVGMIGAAPLVMLLLYGPDFAPAVDLLRIQLLGDVLKLLGWPLGFVLLALAASRRFVINELLGIGAFIVVTWLLIGSAGLKAPGWGYALMLLANLILSQWAVRTRLPGFRWERRVLLEAGILLAVAGFLWRFSPHDVAASAAVGAVAAAVTGGYSYRRLVRHFPDLAAGIRARLSRRAP